MQIGSKRVPRARKEIKLTPADEARFWSNVDKSAGPDGCWIWTSHTVNGYGWFIMHGKNNARLAHRIGWSLINGPIPHDGSYHGICVCHNCPGGDRRECVNPSHMFLGTHADNIRDMVKKGRNHIPPHGFKRPKTRSVRKKYSDTRSFLKGRSRGEAHSEIMKMVASRGDTHKSAKLNAEKVLEIRALYPVGNTNYNKLGNQFGVDRSVIRAVVQRKTWKHVLP